MQDNHIDVEQLPKIDHEQCGQEMAFDVRRLRNNDMTDPFRFFRYIQPAFILSKKGNPGLESRPVWRLNTWHDLYAKHTLNVMPTRSYDMYFLHAMHVH